ncbi:hypothetical protein E1742_24160 [Pseudoduganella plicata]|uniref:Transcription factor zinc-finger domain-containing protein n=1 Tax=Pseudoduganella plicata TaxID=321984 RepID=A0ABX5SI55_9BURK|nr:hypothetical protein E1742_24160 [Pseudoduganella plicata]
MLCPRCNQGDVIHARVKKTGQHLFVCEECEATWFSREAIGLHGFIDFGSYMETIGSAPLWSEITIEDS